MARPYGLANQMLCYIQIYKIFEEKDKRMFLRMVGEYGPWSISYNNLLQIVHCNDDEKPLFSESLQYNMQL